MPKEHPFRYFMNTLRKGENAINVKSEADQGGIIRRYARPQVPPGESYPYDHGAPDDYLTFDYPCIIDHLVFGTNLRFSMSLLIEVRNEEDDWIQTYVPYHLTDGFLDNTPENIVENLNTVGIWDILEYNTERSRYFLKFKKPIVFPSGVRFTLANVGDLYDYGMVQIVGRRFS